MTSEWPLSLFEGFGIELEYMVVDEETLAVRPVVDQVLTAAGAGDELEVTLGEVAISNELALHVLEFKIMIHLLSILSACIGHFRL